MKSLAALFAHWTTMSGLLALALSVAYQAWRMVRARAEREITKAILHTNQIQARLGKLSVERQTLERVGSYAQGHKMRAATLAYDRLLAEACAHAGVDVEPKCDYQDLERLRRERALNQLGWSW